MRQSRSALGAAVAAVIEAVLRTDEIPEVALPIPCAPGVTHRFINHRAYTEEVANARIYAGLHYRTSTIVGREMGQNIGAWVVKSVTQPAVTLHCDVSPVTEESSIFRTIGSLIFNG